MNRVILSQQRDMPTKGVDALGLFSYGHDFTKQKEC